MDHLSPNHIKESVLLKIAQEKLVMQPRHFFVFRWISFLLVALFVLVLSVLTISFAAYSIHESGEVFLLGFGARGWYTFFSLFPWLLVLFTFAGIIILEMLARGFTTAYRVPVLYLFAGFVVLCALLGWSVAQTPFHDVLSEYAEKNNHPFLNGWYERLSLPNEEYGEFRGTVVSIEKEYFMVSHNDGDSDEDDGLRKVVPLKGTRVIDIKVGDELYIAGELEDGVIYSYGIGKLR